MSRPREGTTFLETLLALALVVGVVGVGVGGAWVWSRTRSRIARHQEVLAGAADRMERLLALPAATRPGPGTWRAEAAPPELGAVLAPLALASGGAEVELVVEAFPVEYTDPFFAGGGRLRCDDLVVLRLRVGAGEAAVELAAVR